MKKYLFSLAIYLQIAGFLSVTWCLYSGLSKGDYGRLELIAFVGGALFFYVGNGMKKSSQSS